MIISVYIIFSLLRNLLMTKMTSITFYYYSHYYVYVTFISFITLLFLKSIYSRSHLYFMYNLYYHVKTKLLALGLW